MIIGTVNGAQSYRQLLQADRLLAMLQYTYGQFEESEASLRKATPRGIICGQLPGNGGAVLGDLQSAV